MKWIESLSKQIECLTNAKEFLISDNSKSMEFIISVTENVEGFHYFTGIGKNGFVAAKVASTFNSLGIRSMFVDPVNTLHGDMDIFSSKDILYVLSKSGETEELIRFANALIKNDFTNIILITSAKTSSLQSLSRYVLYIPVETEGDHLEMAPVASSVVYMVVLQSIGVELSSKRGFTRKDFIRCHPGGTLGKWRESSERN